MKRRKSATKNKTAISPVPAKRSPTVEVVFPAGSERAKIEALLSGLGKLGYSIVKSGKGKRKDGKIIYRFPSTTRPQRGAQLPAQQGGV